MYFTRNNNFFHGIMFHHFYDNKIHIKSQGAISKNDLIKLIKFIGRKNILDADEFIVRYKENKLNKTDICLTFDDGLKCQHDIALPILEDFKIKAFFFISSSIFTKNPDLGEIYRYFRTKYFKDINDFYKNFFNIYKKKFNKSININKSEIKKIRLKYPFYSINDVKFRLIRNNVLQDDEYKSLMLEMFYKKNFNQEKFYRILFLNKKNLKKMKNLGHHIGLHSHTHPIMLEKMSYNQQLKEYINNQKFISKIINSNKKKIISMSHPFGSYNKKTLRILKNLGLEIGFKQIITKDKNMKKINNSNFEIARQDHANIMRMINK